jgi:hypothetical protein
MMMMMIRFDTHVAFEGGIARCWLHLVSRESGHI